MAAPTGKAAARLNEAISLAKKAVPSLNTDGLEPVRTHIPESAVTLHRLLGGGGGPGNSRFQNDDRRRIAADVLVVDESSMVDLAMMTRLVEALPRDTRLILLGDKDQLSSVEAGAVLGDICQGASTQTQLTSERTAPSAEVPADIGRCIVQLTHSYRFGEDSGIGYLSRAINAGDPDAAVACLEDPSVPSVTLIDGEGTDSRITAETLRPFVDTHYIPCLDDVNPASRLLRFNRFRILCAHRKGPGGVEAVNQTVTEMMALKTGLGIGQGWFNGRPIMVTHNDYALGLFNGDIGMIGPSPEIPPKMVAFFAAPDGQIRSFSPYRLSAHETVFAMTIHKSQGAEFDEVLILLPPRRSPIVTRELLYTAVTRARKRVTLCGPEAVIREAIRTPVERASGVGEQLWGSSVGLISPDSRP